MKYFCGSCGIIDENNNNSDENSFCLNCGDDNWFQLEDFEINCYIHPFLNNMIEKSCQRLNLTKEEIIKKLA